MRTLTIRILFLAGAVCAACAADDPGYLGRWKLDASKSDFGTRRLGNLPGFVR